MLVRLYWPGCRYWGGAWTSLALDAYWVECSAEAARQVIHPRLPDEKMQLSGLLGRRYRGPQNRNDQPGARVCCLAAKDLTRIDPHPVVYPWSGQWNGSCPFRELGEHHVESLEAVAAIPLPEERGPQAEKGDIQD